MINQLFHWIIDRFHKPKPLAISQKWFDGELGKELQENVNDPIPVDSQPEAVYGPTEELGSTSS